MRTLDIRASGLGAAFSAFLEVEIAAASAFAPEVLP